MRIQNPSLPIGSYVCEFVGVQPFSHPEFGDGLRWEFEVVRGKKEGARTSRVTKDVPTIKNSAGRFLAALDAKSPSEDMDVEPQQFVGREYRVTVAASPGSPGSTRVESFAPFEEDEAPAAWPVAAAVVADMPPGDDIPF